MKHFRNQIESGVLIEKASKILIMIHGRGASAEDILSIEKDLTLPEFHLIAPQAPNNSWYPHSFLSPLKSNEPWLSSSLNLISGIVNDLIKEGFIKEQIYLLGFSQGACLALEYSAQNTGLYGGIIAFSGGLIGDFLQDDKYTGNLYRTKIFIGSNYSDPHIPLNRCKESEEIFKRLNANVRLKIYPGSGHHINSDEIEEANKILINTWEK